MKSAYISLIIGPRGLECDPNLEEIMGWESSDVVRFDLRPLLQGQMRIGKLKSAYNLLIIEAPNSRYPPEASGGYFGLAFATLPPPRVERFSALTL